MGGEGEREDWTTGKLQIEYDTGSTSVSSTHSSFGEMDCVVFLSPWVSVIINFYCSVCVTHSGSQTSEFY